MARQLEATDAENRALKKMQRQLVHRMEQQDAAVEDMPARIAALQEEARVASERMRSYKDEAQRATAAGDAHRERLMRLQGEHRRLKKKLAGEGIAVSSGTRRRRGKKGGGAPGSGDSTPASMASPGGGFMASPAPGDVLRRSKAKWDGQKDELLQRIMLLERELVDSKALSKSASRPRDSMAAGNPEAEEAQRLLRANVTELTRLKQSLAKQQKALEEKQAELDAAAAQAAAAAGKTYTGTTTAEEVCNAPPQVAGGAAAAAGMGSCSWAGPRASASPTAAACAATTLAGKKQGALTSKYESLPRSACQAAWSLCRMVRRTTAPLST
jgi:ParB family chromosome partitioning protein